jgi:D-alanine-D-alanine ligase
MKPKVAIVMGGYSSEFSISVESGEAVYYALINSKFLPYKVLITKDRWVVVVENELFPIDKNDFSCSINGEKIEFDLVFNAIHGSPGEDGLFPAYLNLLGIKQTSCNFFESALTFNKSKTNVVISQMGVLCPQGIYLNNSDSVDPNKIVETLGLPLFVKPSRAGSSFGVTKVTAKNQIGNAVAEANKEDSEIVIESAVVGVEVGCGLARLNGKVEVLAITEIVSKNDFFDYQAKYEGASDEITPARISDELTKEINEISTKVYDKLSLKGVVRIDYIIDESSQQPVFIEVNTVPGLAGASIVPQQITYKGYSLQEFFTLLLDEEMR